MTNSKFKNNTIFTTVKMVAPWSMMVHRDPTQRYQPPRGYLFLGFFGHVLERKLGRNKPEMSFRWSYSKEQIKSVKQTDGRWQSFFSSSESHIAAFPSPMIEQNPDDIAVLGETNARTGIYHHRLYNIQTTFTALGKIWENNMHSWQFSIAIENSPS